MSLPRKQYDVEFKLGAVQQADGSEKGHSVIERELGLYQEAIRT